MGPRHARAPELAFGIVVLAWGFNYLVVRAGLTLAGPVELALLRAGIGLAAVALLVPALGWSWPMSRRDRRDALLLGIPNTTAFFGLWFVAAGSVLPGEAATVIYTFPLWVAVLAQPILGIRLTPGAIAATVVGFVGVALISEPWKSGSGTAPAWAIAALLGAAVSWALGTVLMQRRFSAAQLPQANVYQLAGGCLGLIPALLVPGAAAPLSPSWTLVGESLWLGVLGTAVAYSIWFYLLGRVGAPKLSGFTFLVPLVALGASALVFGERLDLIQVLGAGLVLGAVAAIGRTGGVPAARRGTDAVSKTSGRPGAEGPGPSR